MSRRPIGGARGSGSSRAHTVSRSMTLALLCAALGGCGHGSSSNEGSTKSAQTTVDVAAIQPAIPRLRALHAIYGHTFILEDSHLSALVTGLAEHDLDGLPDTASEQRAAIIQWRTGLAVLARRAHFKLPADLQVAGRGEIRPSPDGS